MITLVKNERGAAMTEAVVVIPFFLIIWMSLIFLHHMYKGRLEAQTVSMSAALKNSYGGCKGTLTSDESSERLSPEANGWVQRIANEQPLGWTLTHGTCTKTVSGIPALFHGPERQVRAKQHVMCNMRPKKGIIDLVFGMVKSVVGIE
jgi:hypothetical protein